MSKLSEQTGVDWNAGTALPFLNFSWMAPSDWDMEGSLGKDDDGGSIESASGNQANEIAIQMFKETEPLRENILARSEAFMGEDGGFDPTQSAMYKPRRDALETQYMQSNELARQNMPAGGSLNEALAGNVRTRASGLTGLEGDITQDEYNKAYGMATGVPALSLSTLTNLAGSEMSAAAQEQAAKSGLLGEFGNAMGYIFGSK